MEFSLPRGMRDLKPDDYSLLERIREVFIETCRLFGFKVMEPSPIEMLTTLEAKSGSAIKDEIYCFRDKSGREVGLRFDLTVGITRYVTSQRGLPLPIKMGAFSGMWRYDEPQHGRYRWFHQWDAEVFGPSSVEADAEVIEFTSVLFEKLGLVDVVIRVGDRRLVEEFIRSKLAVVDDGRVVEMLRAVDKIGKKTVPQILDEYEGKGVKRDLLQRLIDLGRVKGDSEQVLRDLEEQKLQRRDALAELSDALKARDVKGFSLDLGVVRGLDYYTGMVFEVYDNRDVKLGALAGGGRFDVLPKAFGRSDMGAVGVAGGVDRMMFTLAQMKSNQEAAGDVFAYLSYANRDLSKAASHLASNLRREGVPTELELSERSLHRQLEVASASKIPFVVIVAPREHSQGKVVFRDMMRGTEETVSVSDLTSILKQRMQGVR